MTLNLDKNTDARTVAGFGDEWSRFDQSALSDEVRKQIFSDYFEIFPWKTLPENAKGADIGCGSGRWAKVVAPRVGNLILLDASSEALSVARKNLSDFSNVAFIEASVGDLPIDDDSLDFAYSLGVLHHVPNTEEALKAVVQKLKPGAPFLVYLYYAFDNRPAWYYLFWVVSDVLRKTISVMPNILRYWLSQFLACIVYWPLSRVAFILNKMDICPNSWPLKYYSDKPFYVMRTDALDRFGTRLEQRFSKQQITLMLTNAGLTNIRFSDKAPFWCAVGLKG